MDFNFTTELIIRILMAIALMAILGKVIAPALFNFYRTLRQKDYTSANNLDFLIRMQEDRLRRGKKNLGPESMSSQDLNTNFTLATAYQNEFKNASSGQDVNLKNNKEEIKKILNLIDELQWGNGKELSRMQSEIFRLIKEKIDVAKINHCCQLIFKSPKLATTMRAMALPNLQQIHQMVTIRTICEHFTIYLAGHSTEGLPITKIWAQKVSGNLSSVNQGLDLFLQSIFGRSEEKIFQFLLESPGQFYLSHLPSHEVQHLLTTSIIHRHKILEWQTVQEKVLHYSKIVESIRPVPILENDQDFQLAQQILQVNSKDSWEIIKKKYKVLALNKHPDKIQFPYYTQKFNAIAKTNFQNIQRALDVLKKYKS